MGVSKQCLCLLKDMDSGYVILLTDTRGSPPPPIVVTNMDKDLQLLSKQAVKGYFYCVPGELL